MVDLKYQDLTPTPESLAISPLSVARLARCGPSTRWQGALDEAIAEARSLVKPWTRWTPIEETELEAFFPSSTPVATVVTRGPRWAFIASIGDGLETRAREHLDAARFLEGVLLDAAGSMAVEAVCDIVQTRCVGEAPARRFSPGYCHWSLEAQRQMFRCLQPEDRGLRLLPSMLMNPLKSVSGLIVQAAEELLHVPPEACAECEVPGCTRRRHRPARRKRARSEKSEGGDR